MKYFLIIISFCLPFTVKSQLHADIYGGLSNYQGDLQGTKYTFKNSGPALGLGLVYDLTNKFSLRGMGTYLKVQGDDKNNKTASGTAFRNLNFTTKILELQLAVEYNLFDLSERKFTPYVFAGIAAFHFNPYSFDSAGNKVFLRPLNTEGEGLPEYPQKKQYSNNQFAIPFGGGVKFVLSDRIQLGVEIGLRKLFTDYLDDVSTTYADSSILFAERGPQSVAFAYRGNELHTGTFAYPAAGSQRGNSKNKDWYYTTGVHITYLFGAGGGSSRSSRKSKVGCPANVN